jgi:hypothetical protein
MPMNDLTGPTRMLDFWDHNQDCAIANGSHRASASTWRTVIRQGIPREFLGSRSRYGTDNRLKLGHACHPSNWLQPTASDLPGNQTYATAFAIGLEPPPWIYWVCVRLQPMTPTPISESTVLPPLVRLCYCHGHLSLTATLQQVWIRLPVLTDPISALQFQ